MGREHTLKLLNVNERREQLCGDSPEEEKRQGKKCQKEYYKTQNPFREGRTGEKQALAGFFRKPVVFWVPCNDITASYKSPVMKSVRKNASFSQLKSMFQRHPLFFQT